MGAKRIRITPSQRRALVAELEEAKEQLASATEARERARAEGDLAENSPFEAANRECERLGSVIVGLTQTIESCQTVENIDTSKVGVLTKIVVEVTVKGSPYTDTRTLIMVDPGQGKLPNFVSLDSKLGMALQDCQVGTMVAFQDNVFVEKTYKIVSIEEAD